MKNFFILSPFAFPNRVYSERHSKTERKAVLPLKVIQSNTKRAENAVERYGDALFRLCSVMLGNRDDALDAVQETFLKYITKAPNFNDSEHEKAWLLRVASNECKDVLRSRKRTDFLTLDDIKDLGVQDENDAQVLVLLASLDEKYRAVIQLYYIEGYKIKELSQILGITQATAKKRLQRGRELLRRLTETEAI